MKNGTNNTNSMKRNQKRLTSKEAKLYQRRLVLKMPKTLWHQRLQREFHSKTTLLVWTCSMLLRSRIPTLHGKES